MSPHRNTAVAFDLAPKDKIRFVATVLPILAALGGVLRASGGSEEALLIVVVPLLFVVFFGWRFAMALKTAQHATDSAEREFWEVRDAQSTQRLQELVEAQQMELRELRLRQNAEQERLMREHASAEQLARMMERHRSQYEALLSRRTA